MGKLLLLNGPNLNLLGQRNKDQYGQKSLQHVEQEVRAYLQSFSFHLDSFQSNHEGELVDWIHKANEEYEGVLLNPGAYTHTSVALRDAIEAVDVPVVEIHISNIHNRESFRHHSFIAPVAAGQVVGFGTNSYIIGAFALIESLKERES
ncbi:type II 3-dehydroquinate dehydratase [Alkalibacillus haloalkaliphilus]|uniref:type II 3-dehydroquinate dehydratase n=1 Tax=Alkalibacillus haloalkaliphilus TaxID=94136 RepID=UPI0002D71CA0|nr:type II 3-dehydroquinate dehydratase [Alkalibacillus haloalkaliphilus]